MLSIKEELLSLRKQVGDSKSELYIQRFTPLDNRAKSFSSDKKKHKISVRKAKVKIKELLARYKKNEECL